MSSLLLAVIVLIPLGWHLGLTAFVYYDTGRMPLERRKWTLLVGLIPLFGFFMYLFERSELDYDPAEDPYAGGSYNIHPSRADDAPFADNTETLATEGDETSDRAGDDGREK